MDRAADRHGSVAVTRDNWQRLTRASRCAPRKRIKTKTGARYLKQTEIAQFPAQRLRHRRDAGAGGPDIRRDIALGEVAPALERPHRPRQHRDDLGLHHEATPSDPVAVT